MTLEELAAQGIHRLPIPTPFAVGRVNLYLVESEPLTLFDAGPNSGLALDEVEQSLRRLGHAVEDVRRIVITHQHIDHMGLASILARRSGAEVCALDVLAPWLARYEQAIDADDAFAEELMRRHGIAEDVRWALRSVTHSFRAWGAACEVTTPLAAGDVLEFSDRSLTVLHRPGHSPSDTVFHDADRRLLVGGDHLLGRVSSNALISRPLTGPADAADRPRALMTYAESLRATAAMDLDVVLPGHGELVTDHRGLVEERLRLQERRARKIGGLIAREPRTAYALAHALWGNVAVTQAFLTLSEILGHVDILLAEGAITAVEDDHGVVTFHPA